MELHLVEICFTLAFLGFTSLLVHLYYLLIWKPRSLRSKLLKQGIKGPPPSILYGNIPDMKKIQSAMVTTIETVEQTQQHHHDCFSKIFPYFKQWIDEYGPMFTYSTGNIQLLYVPCDMVKEIGLCTSLNLGKPIYLTKDRGPLFGHGILSSSGLQWEHQRKIIAPEFYMDKVKGMINIMVKSATPLLKSWENQIEAGGGIGHVKVDEDLRSFSADIISKACFGSNYSRGKEIFLRLRALQKIMSGRGLLIGVPGLSYIPTKNNKEMWNLQKGIRSLILEVVKERQKEKSEMDLLQSILEGSKNGELGRYSADDFVVDNCKNIYFAGHETTTTSASWILMLLASHPEWQTRVRDEVIQACDGCLPNVDTIRKMKMLTMVIQEAMRLYPVAPFVPREVFADMKFGDIHVPKGVILWIPLLSIHQDPTIWGPDAHLFKPERFAQGIGNACKPPQAYIPFGIGPRVCVGQNMAMAELKIILALILSNFSFTLSPQYRHSPSFSLVIEPRYGIVLLIKKI
ncbi:hypothetical protein GIB67_041955 [Kingdonia uniflora]|uniref:Cytochrome P450 n=1 Tax=Kingdonia uniflora TaxID=39325 RepID=A0A7J7P071_9MAGN|nr:hypothetical protein GIB67_041955 [Kingdonia uniflora]